MYGLATQPEGLGGVIRLAENPRTAAKAAIKRASKSARRQVTSLVNRDLKELEAIYRQAAKDIQNSILGMGGLDGNLRAEVLQDLMNQVNQRLRVLSRTRNDLLDRGLFDAADLGVEPFVADPQVSIKLNNLANDAVEFVQTFVAEDGLQLSDRLHRLDLGARQAMAEAIESAVIQGHSASRAVEDFLSRGVTVPRDIANKQNLSNAERVARMSGVALLRDENSARANAMRVFRTEIGRAHIEAYRAAAFEHPEVVGTQFLLSPNHPRPDICDMHARVNRYGLGPGVYPKGRSPLPAHPNTLSFEVVVFSDEVSTEDRAGKETRIEWLKKQTPGTQEGVLASKKKRAALVDEILKESEISTPWKVLKKKYIKRGVDVDDL